MNKNAKSILWDNIPKRLVPFLAYRVFQGCITVFLVTLSIKFLPLLIVSVFNNLVPLLMALLGFILLKERITPV
jgi:drug/metabolite transporter (DMT)-like permease